MQTMNIISLGGKGVNCRLLLGVALFYLFDIFNPVIGQELSFTTNTYPTGLNPHCVVAADVNGDGKLDLISASSIGQSVTVLTNNGTGLFGSNATINVGTEPDFVVAADIKGEGKPDLITANGDDKTLTVFTNNGSGGFGSNATLNVGAFIQDFAVADINGDGSLDLIAPNFVSNSLAVFTNDGSGVFGFSTNIPAVSPFCVVAADVNADGKPDLITANVENTLTVFTNNGSGGFGSNATLRLGFLSQGSPVCVVAADLSGEGKSDLITVNFYDSQSYGTMTLLTNNGSGIFGIFTTMQVGIDPTWVVAADVNGDGKLDLIEANAGEGNEFNTLSVFINDSTFPPPTTTPTLNISIAGKDMTVSWPSASAGWSLQQNPDLMTANWLPSGYSGYGILDDGTNESLTMPPPPGNLFFRLLHP
jgi:hypothetical protein